MTLRLALLTTLSLLAFAGNSLICRMALQLTEIDPATFNTIRLVSGAVFLGLFITASRSIGRIEGTWVGAVALFIYAIAFAYAYSGMPAGTGALLLFGSIQVAMLITGMVMGERFSQVQLLGLGLAVIGLVALMWPAVGAPDPSSGVLMVISGVAWAVYTLMGRGAGNPMAATAGNFLRATPIAIGFYLVGWATFGDVSWDIPGVFYALVSGVVTSGMGYICWYASVKELKVTHAATVQLSVPIIAAVGGVIFLNEAITQLLVFVSISVLCGIALVIFNPTFGFRRVTEGG